MNNKIKDEYFTATKMNLDVVFGYQVITKGGFTLDIYAGLGLKIRSFETDKFDLGTTFDEWKLKDLTSVGFPFGFTFGYAF
jgi:hypothetical protein